QGSIGARYMFNEKYGVKLSFGYSSIKNDSNSITSFETAYYGGNVEWVLNAGNLLNFQNWSEQIGLLAHTGFGFAQIVPQTDNTFYEGGRDNLIVFVVGVSPQYKISDRFSLFLDFSLLTNFKQHFTWDRSEERRVEKHYTVALHPSHDEKKNIYA